MIFLSLAYIAAYVLPIYLYPVSHQDVVFYRAVEYGTWALFVIDYIVQISLADDKKKFFTSEWFALVILLIPFFRPIRAIRGLLVIRQSMSKRRSLVRSLPEILGSMAVLLILIIGAAVLNSERFAPGATIKTPSDALWWAFTTLTTSSDGNLTPMTSEGRALGAVLLIFGLGLLASTTGAIAGWVLKQLGDSEA